MDTLERDFNYYLENKSTLLADYLGKFIVIKDCKVIGSFDDRLKAVIETSKTHKVGTFLVQHVLPGNEEEHARFHSRVAL